MSALLFENLSGAKPFLKWAGGKGQLISSIEKSLPPNFANLTDVTYVEPFIGSGAVLFWLLKKFNNIKQAIINDINSDLTKAYECIKFEPEALIMNLQDLQNTYHLFKDEEDRRAFFME